MRISFMQMTEFCATSWNLLFLQNFYVSTEFCRIRYWQWLLLFRNLNPSLQSLLSKLPLSLNQPTTTGVTFCSNLKFDKHVKNILTICSQRCYLLKCLKAQGLPAKQLNVVFSAIVMSRIIYALPAWGGFLSNDLVAKLDAFFKKAFRWGYSCDLRRLSVLLQEADEHLFIKCFITRITVFTSYYLWKRFYPWNSGPRIVFLLCLSVTLTCTNVRLYCDICLVMHIRFCM